MLTERLSDGTTLNVYAQRCSLPNVLAISFNRDGYICATGQGLAHRVFSKVTAFVIDLHRLNPSTTLILSADVSEPSRVSLYRAMCERFARANGLQIAECERDGERFFILGDPELAASIADGELEVYEDE